MKTSTSLMIQAALALGVGLALCPSEARADSPDGWITTKVKIALFTAPDVNPTRVHVDTVNGTVILHGKVRTLAEKVSAKKIAGRFRGTRNVRDLLEVVPVKDEVVIQRADDEIREEVEHLLKDNSALTESQIAVKSVDRGVVLLDGTASSLTDYLTAVSEVREMPGVRRVSSEVKSTELLAEPKVAHVEIGRVRVSKVDSPPAVATATPAAPAPSPGVEHSPVRDAWTTIATKMRLLADSEVPALDVGVEAVGGAVTLFGIVPTERARAAAEADTLKIDSVKSVNNELEVVPQALKKTVQVEDEAIRKSVLATFRPVSDLSSVNVSVNNAVVHLSGSVPSEWSRLRAATLARAAKGVQAVNDDLQIERQRASR